MKRAAGWAFACLLAVLVCVVPAGAAQASQPSLDGASSATRFSLTVNRTVLHGGDSLTVTAKANVRCTWLIEWDGLRRHTVGRTFTTTFTAPKVEQRTTMTLRGTCFYNVTPPTRTKGTSSTTTPSHVDAQTIEVFVPPSWVRALGITVLPGKGVVSPPHGGGGGGGVGPGGLPNTGGPDLWLLLAGLGLVLLGAAAVRRAARSDLDAFSVRP